MAWSASDIAYLFNALSVKLEGAFGALTAGFDREKWEELRKGVDYSEVAPALETDGGGAPNFAWAMALEMLRYAGIVVLVVALVVVVLKLLGVVKFGKPKHEAEPVAPTDATADEQQSLEALQQALEVARNRGDYREAVRLLYQIALRHLAAAGMLQVMPEKTNWEYVYELGHTRGATEFADLTVLYEYVWFGKGRSDSTSFPIQEKRFQEFINHTTNAV